MEKLETILRAEDNTNSYSYYNNSTDTREFTENNHKTGPISYHKRKELTGLRKGLVVSLALLSSLFPIACGKHKKPYIPPQAPTFITETLPDAKENSPYSTIITASDPQSDPVTYSITGGTADVFLTIDPNTGELTNDTAITDVESGINHTLNVKATDDKGNFTEKAFLLYVINAENVNGNIKDVTNDNNLSGVQVKLGTNSTLTDVTGNYTFNDIEDNTYQMEINDNTGNEDNYLTHKPNNLISSKQKNLEGKLNNINFKLIPISLEAGDTKTQVLNHINNCIMTQYDPEADIKKWETRPEIKIYTLEASIGNPVSITNINLVKDIINNEIDKVDNLFTTPTIIELAQTPPAGFENGVIMVYWSDDMVGAVGINEEQFSGSNIIAAYAGCKTDQTRNTWIQELTECIIGGGESNLYSSVLNDPTTVSDYTATDLKLWKIFQNRPAGNKNLGTAHNYDVNPSDYIINP